MTSTIDYIRLKDVEADIHPFPDKDPLTHSKDVFHIGDKVSSPPTSAITPKPTETAAVDAAIVEKQVIYLYNYIKV